MWPGAREEGSTQFLLDWTLLVWGRAEKGGLVALPREESQASWQIRRSK